MDLYSVFQGYTNCQLSPIYSYTDDALISFNLCLPSKHDLIPTDQQVVTPQVCLHESQYEN